MEHPDRSTDPVAQYQHALDLHNSGRLQEAVAIYQQLLARFPKDPLALAGLGRAMLEAGRLDEAARLFDLSLASDPAQPKVATNRGVALLHLGRLQEALASFDRAIVLDPGLLPAHNNRGLVLYYLNRLDDALAGFDRAIALKPDSAEAYCNRGNVLHGLMRLNDALASHEIAIKLRPDYAQAYGNRGNVLHDLQRLDEALSSYDRAIALNPNDAEVHSNRGNVLYELKRLDEALASHDRALALNPDYAEGYSNRGNVLHQLRRLDEALAMYNKAIALNPGYAEAYSNRGNVLHDMARLEEALASHSQAIALTPDWADAYINRGHVLSDLKRLDEAVENYDRALKLKPDSNFLHGIRLHARMKICDWHGVHGEIEELASRIERNEAASPPFPLLSLMDSPALQKKAAELYAQYKHPPHPSLPGIPRHPRHDKIRVGYFSADFRDHPVSLLTAELFETHDKSRFELTAFSFGPDTGDEIRKRVKSAFNRFVDVRNRSDQDIAALARDYGIDIAVDLGGYTSDSRPGIFSYRAAPIQVSYLGYLGTMGAPYIDYLLADATLIPEASKQHYKEKIAYLPSYQVNDSCRTIADQEPSRQMLGLPETGFVFCCFNNNYKIMPDIFDSWMRILKAVTGSVLFLYAENDIVGKNLRKEAAQRGVDASRLVFGKRLPHAEYLARYRAADLFLDTLPYNAGTTASDALWAGLPVLTCAGETFAGRMAASLLHAIHLEEMVATTQEEYEALAITLATQPQRLAQIRKQLADNRLTAPLFDTRRITRHIEAAYTEMYERYQAGQSPDHIRVQS